MHTFLFPCFYLTLFLFKISSAVFFLFPICSFFLCYSQHHEQATYLSFASFSPSVTSLFNHLSFLRAFRLPFFFTLYCIYKGPAYFKYICCQRRLHTDLINQLPPLPHLSVFYLLWVLILIVYVHGRVTARCFDLVENVRGCPVVFRDRQSSKRSGSPQQRHKHAKEFHFRALNVLLCVCVDK